MYDEAVAYWLKAGQRSTQRSSNLDAISHFERGLALVELIERFGRASTDRVQVLRGARHTADCNQGLHCTRTGAVVRTCASTERGDRRYRGDLPCPVQPTGIRARRRAIRPRGRARRGGDSDSPSVTRSPIPLLLPAGCSQHSSCSRGRRRPLASNYKQMLAQYDPVRHSASALTFGQDHFVACASYLTLGLWFLGFTDQARRLSERAIEYARSLNHTHTLQFALGICRRLVCSELSRRGVSAIDDRGTAGDRQGTGVAGVERGRQRVAWQAPDRARTDERGHCQVAGRYHDIQETWLAALAAHVL